MVQHLHAQGAREKNKGGELADKDAPAEDNKNTITTSTSSDFKYVSHRIRGAGLGDALHRSGRLVPVWGPH